MILYIVRHGETDWNTVHRLQGHTDIPLNDFGRHLAEETAAGLAGTPIDLAYTSPLKRAEETARIILKGRDVPLYEEERLCEIGFGTYEGVCRDTEDAGGESPVFRLFFRDTGNYVPPEGGESVQELYRRTGDFLEELLGREELREKHILISTHGAAMTALLNRIRGSLSVSGFWAHKVPPNCSVTTVRAEGGKLTIVEEGKVYYKEKVKGLV